MKRQKIDICPRWRRSSPSLNRLQPWMSWTHYVKSGLSHWHAGTPLGTIGDALCGLHFFWPQVKGQLRGSWKLYKNWRRIEVPQRAPPLPRQICLALVGYFLHREQVFMAFLLALGFHAFLRTGEILKLQCQDITMGSKSGVVVVRRSKSGLRFNMDESVALYDHHLPRLWELCQLDRTMGRSDYLWQHSGSKFRDLFYEGLAALHLQDMGFQPYSIRRGGATHSFATSLALDRVILRGRWRSLSVARIYLEDGQAQLSTISLTKHQKALLATFTSGLPPTFYPNAARRMNGIVEGHIFSWTCHVSFTFLPTCHAWVQFGPVGLLFAGLQPVGSVPCQRAFVWPIVSHSSERCLNYTSSDMYLRVLDRKKKGARSAPL